MMNNHNMITTIDRYNNITHLLREIYISVLCALWTPLSPLKCILHFEGHTMKKLAAFCKVIGMRSVTPFFL